MKKIVLISTYCDTIEKIEILKENIIKKQTLDHDDSEEKINKESVQNIKEDDKINVDMGNGLIAKMSLKDLDKVTKI